MADSSNLRIWRAWTWALLATMAAIAAGFCLWHLTVRHMVDSAEVRVLAYVLWWQKGVLPYTGVDQLPIVVNPYGPLYTWLCTWLPNGAPRPYLAGRLLSLGAGATVLLLVAYWIRRRTANTGLALLAVLLLLCAKPFFLFASLYRVDTLGLALSLAGLCALTLWDTRRGLAAAVFFFLLAFATKSSYVAAPLASFLYLWLRDRRRAVVFATAIAAGFVSIVAAMELLTGGVYLFDAAVGSPLNAPDKAADIATRPLVSLFWLLALVYGARLRGRALRRSPALIYTVVSWFVAVAFAINPLTSFNFLAEFYVGLALLTGEILESASGSREFGDRRVWKLLAAHAVFTLLMGGEVIYNDVRGIRAYGTVYHKVEANLAERLRAGQRVVILRSDAARDLLNAAGSPNRVNAPKMVELSPQTEAILLSAAAKGEIDTILVGDELQTLRPKAKDALD